MNDKQKNIALARADFLVAYGNVAQAAELILPAKQQFIDAYNIGAAGILPNVYKVLGSVSFKTAERWRKQLTDAGGDLEALATNYRYKSFSERKLTDIEKNKFLDVLLRPTKIDIGHAIALTKYTLKLNGIPSTSSDMTFRRFAADYYEQHRTTWIQMREGEKALKDKLLPYIERDINRLEVGDVFVADGKTTTFNIINPYTGHAQKATLIGHLDWKSKDLAGWELMLTENVQAIASSLRNGIMRLGRTCKITYQDNGKAFKARFFQNSPSFEECGFYGVFGRLSITPVFSMPYNARAKVIERFWREFVEGGEKLVPSFTGTSPTDKAAYVMRNEKFHKQLHEEKYGVDGVAITLDEAKYFIDNWLSFYRSLESPHVSGKAIGEVFNEARIIDNPIQEKLLDDLMMQLEDKDYKIGRNGVNILNSHYYAPELTHIVGDDVRVKVSIFDYSYVKVFTCDGRFVCRAERVEKTHPMAFHLGNAKDQQDFKERLKIQQRAKKEVMHNTAIQMRYLQGAANMIADGTYGVPLKSIEQPLQLVESAPEAPESDESFINPYEG